MNSHTAYFPWPSNNLSPNSRPHWSKRAAAVKAYKTACGWTLAEAGIRGPIDADTVHVAMTFFPPDRRHYDLDGLISRMKAGLDAISAAIGVDDRHFTLSAFKGPPSPKHGQVKVEIEWAIATREARAA